MAVFARSAVEPFLSPGDTLGLGLRRLNRQISHADQVVSGCRKGEDPSYLEDSTVPDFPQQGNGLEPTEALFDALPLPLTDGISRVLRRASINRTPAWPLKVLGYVRRDL